MHATMMSAVDAAALQREHGALLRYLGRLQQGLGGEVSRLERENLRLRAALLVQRTAWLWGLAPPKAASVPQHDRAPTASASTSLARASVSQVLCQVACEGHAHHWLAEAGQCRRSGEACERLTGCGPSPC